MANRNRKHRNVNLVQWLCVVLVALAMLAVAGWLLWQGMLRLSADTARVLLLVAVAMWPVVWFLAQMESRGKLAGIDMTAQKFLKPLAQAATLKVGTAAALRQVGATPQAPPAAVLPIIEVVPRLAVGDVIDV